MKKLVLALVAVITMSATAMAQEESRQKRDRQRPDRTEMLKQRTDETVKTYGLNETQAAQLLELNTKFADKMGPRGGQRQGERPSREDMEKRREEMKKNREAYEAELQKILTEDQYKAYQADMQKRMKDGPRGRQGQRPRRNNNNND